MSSNFTSSNASLQPGLDIYQQLHDCLNTTTGIFIIITFTITNLIFLLPLCILVLYLGYQRCCQQRWATTISHFDLFTYHMVITELMNIMGFTLSCCGMLAGCAELVMLSIILCSTNFTGQVFFHLLTCVERYLAVVHPVIYLDLRKVNGIRLRNVTIGCVWLLCFAGTGLSAHVNHDITIILYLVFLVCCVAVTSFCSISVACALIRPGPGESAGDRQQIHKSKLRSFYTIIVILVVLMLRFGGTIFATSLYDLPFLEESTRCGVRMAELWYNLPSSFVLPVLYLYRAGKLSCCKKKNK